MTIYSYGYFPDSDGDVAAAEFKLLCDNLDLLLDNHGRILDTPEYFFCQPKFAWCSYPFIPGSGRLPLGYLLLGWRKEILTDRCAECDGKVLITRFSGPAFEGYYSYTGCCFKCRTKQSGSKEHGMSRLITLVLNLRQDFPETLIHEKSDSNRLSFHELIDGLKQKRKYG